MSSDRSRERNGLPATRRSILTATGSLAIGCLAGCSSVTKTEFEATDVALSSDAQQALTVEETHHDSATTTLSVDAVDAEVTITDKVAAYARGPARGTPTLLESYLGQANGTPGSGSAVVAYGDDLGLGEVTLPFLESEPSVPAEQVSLVVPGSRRAPGFDGHPVTGSDAIVLGSGLGGEGPPESVRGLNWLVDLQDLLPGAYWGPTDDPWTLAKRWLHVDNPYGARSGGDSDNTKVVLALGDLSPEDVFGVPPSEMPGERIESGNSLDGINPMIFGMPAGLLNPPFTPLEQVFEVGVPAPLGGQSFGLGVLSTPTAEVADQSANPLAGMPFTDILTDERTRGLLDQAGLTDAASFEWSTGPKPVTAGRASTAVKLLDQEPELKSFAGTSPGEHGPWWVGVHMARVEHEGDIVIAAAGHRAPILKSQVSEDAATSIRPDLRYASVAEDIMANARTLTAGVTADLELANDT